MKPRIVHVFPAFGTGGPEVRTAVLIDAMTELSHTVLSLSGESSGLARLEQRERVVFRSLERHAGFGNLRKLGRALKGERPDVLVTYGWGGTDAILAARAVGMAAPVHVEDGFLPDEARAQKPARLQVRRFAFRMAATIVVPSRTLQRIASDSWWLPPDRVRYFPNGVDTGRFHPASQDERLAARARLGLSGDAIVIGTVAALRPDKNHERLIRVFAGLSAAAPDARLVIVGDGPERPAIVAAAAAARVGDRLVLPGPVTDPAPLYHAFDIFALTSDTEQMPLSVLEAMASGLPVASTDVGDVRAMLPQGGGGISALGDDEALQGGLQTLYADATGRAKAGQANRARAEAEYSLTRMIDSYRRVFLDRVPDRASARP